MRTFATALGLIVGALSAAQVHSAAGPASARGEPPSGLIEALVVTARLREEPAQDVPFALPAFDGATSEQLRIGDTSSLSRHVPGLSLTSFDGGRFAYFQLRGIGRLSQAI